MYTLFFIYLPYCANSMIDSFYATCTNNQVYPLKYDKYDCLNLYAYTKIFPHNSHVTVSVCMCSVCLCAFVVYVAS